MFGLFDSLDRSLKDERELGNFFAKYGLDTLALLRDRATDFTLSTRDRRHWRRLARKARRYHKIVPALL